MPVDVSVIIVSYNTNQLLEACLRSVFEYTPEKTFEVIVVDNASTDDSIEMVGKHFVPAKTIRMRANVGYARAVNAAIEQCEGRYALLLNPDAELLPGTLDLMVEAADESLETGVTGAKHLDSDDRIQLTWGQFPSVRSEIFRKAIHAGLGVGSDRASGFVEKIARNSVIPDWVSGSCMLVKREAWEKAGLMDESFFLYFEDIDWCRRIQKAGYLIKLLPEVPVMHIGGASTSKFQIDAIEAYRQSQFYFIRKHYGTFHSLLVRAMVTIKSALYGFWHLLSWFAASSNKEREHQRVMAMIHKKIFLIALTFHSDRENH